MQKMYTKRTTKEWRKQNVRIVSAFKLKHANLF